MLRASASPSPGVSTRGEDLHIFHYAFSSSGIFGPDSSWLGLKAACSAACAFAVRRAAASPRVVVAALTCLARSGRSSLGSRISCLIYVVKRFVELSISVWKS